MTMRLPFLIDCREVFFAATAPEGASRRLFPREGRAVIAYLTDAEEADLRRISPYGVRALEPDGSIEDRRAPYPSSLTEPALPSAEQIAEAIAKTKAFMDRKFPEQNLEESALRAYSLMGKMEDEYLKVREDAARSVLPTDSTQAPGIYERMGAMAEDSMLKRDLTIRMESAQGSEVSTAEDSPSEEAEPVLMLTPDDLPEIEVPVTRKRGRPRKNIEV
jgi:hypothetical protein